MTPATHHDCFLVELCDVQTGNGLAIYLDTMETLTKDAHAAFRLPSVEEAQKRADAINAVTKVDGREWRPTNHVFVPGPK